MFLFDAPDFLQSLMITLQFSFCFAFGTAIAIRIGKLSAWRTGRPYIVVLSLLIALVALSQSHELGMAVGADLLIYVVVASSIAGKLLSFAPFVWLGKVSFSLYLVHLPVISALSFSFWSRRPCLCKSIYSRSRQLGSC
jgi:peptidoglycan/LPS O-acetylase OafA/YrhL